MKENRHPRASSGREWLAQGLIAVNLFGWFALMPFATPEPHPGLFVVAAILSLPIAWPIPLAIRATGLGTSWLEAPLAVFLMIFVIIPWLWLNAVLWGRGLVWLLEKVTKPRDF